MGSARTFVVTGGAGFIGSNIAEGLIRRGDRVRVLDNLSTGSPWSDLGSFCAGLYYRSLVDGLEQLVIDQLIDHFCATYAEQVPWPLDRRAIDWYTAAALLSERAFRAVTRMKQGRLQMVDEFMRIATELLLSQMVRI